MVVYVVKHVASYLSMALVFYLFPDRLDMVLLGLITAIVMHSRILVVHCPLPVAGILCYDQK